MKHMKQLLVIALAFFTMGLSAQNMEHKRGAQKERMKKFQEFNPEQLATLKTKRMQLNLDLNQSQFDQLYKLNLETAEKRKAKIEARKKNASKEKPSTEERYQMANARLDAQIALKQEMKRILTKEQYQKWETLREEQAAKKRRFKHKRRAKR